MEMKIIPFGSANIDDVLQEEPELAERLPFGAILLGKSGKVLGYNAAESGHSGWSIGEVLGKDFFSEIASCAVGTRLHDEFNTFTTTGHADVIFDYAFDYGRSPANMRIHLQSSASWEVCWMFVKRV